MIIVYGIPNCDTVKKARSWLGEQELAHAFHDFKKLGVPTDRLPGWISALGWEKLLNRKGTTWRKLDADVQASAVDPASVQALMLSCPSVIKRPVVEWQDAGQNTTVGFDAVRWGELAEGLKRAQLRARSSASISE